MLKINELQARYISLSIDKKREFLANILVKFLDTGENFQIVYEFITKHPQSAGEGVLDEVFQAIMETYKEVLEEEESEKHSKMENLAKKIREKEEEDTKSVNSEAFFD